MGKLLHQNKLSWILYNGLIARPYSNLPIIPITSLRVKNSFQNHTRHVIVSFNLGRLLRFSLDLYNLDNFGVHRLLILQNTPQNWVCLILCTIPFKLCVFGRNIPEVMMCFSFDTVLWWTTFFSAIINLSFHLMASNPLKLSPVWPV